MRSSALISIIFLCLLSCNKNRVWEEGDRNTFTWKGQLVEDCNGEPVANKELLITTAGDVNFEEDWEDTVATGVTDENGYFSLTYKKIKKQNYGIGIQTPNRILLSAPSNKDIERDVAMADCDMVYIEVDNSSGADSIYIALGKPKNHPYRFTITLDDIDSTVKIPVLGIPLIKSSYKDTLFLPKIVGSQWDNSPLESTFTYSMDLSEVKKYMLSLVVDSIPDGYNAFPYQRSGYPVVDEVYIKL